MLSGETNTDVFKCPVCKADTNIRKRKKQNPNTRNKGNPQRDLSDHVYTHFRNEVDCDLQKKKPFICPLNGNGCVEGKDWGNFQNLVRHYTGKWNGNGDLNCKVQISR